MDDRRLAAIATLLALAATGCTAPARGPARAPGKAPSAGCSFAVRRDALPEWARAGFSQPSGNPYVLSTNGRILGVLFGYPLTAPPATAGRANKILWVSRPAAGQAPAPDALRIQARLATDVVTRSVPGGPGPSIVDVPRPGCWHLTLTWANHTDTLDLLYQPAS